jgi:hypothetical protein
MQVTISQNFCNNRVDVNFAELLWLDQIGVPVDKLCFQFIVPFTDMKPDGNTLWAVEGFNQVWREATYRALQADHWSVFGWTTCNPAVQFLKKDVDTHVRPKVVPMTAYPGDIIVMPWTTPHGPIMNTTSLRIAAYPYFLPALAGSHPDTIRSYFPNPVSSVRHSAETGACPEFSAHPFTKDKLSKLSKSFSPVLPYHCITDSDLAKCLYGMQPWKVFEQSPIPQYLFNGASADRQRVVEEMQKPILSSLQQWNNTIEKWLTEHEQHSTIDYNCRLCNRLAERDIINWWHSTDAVKHQKSHCACSRCATAKKGRWRLWTAKGGCTCPKCNKKH